MLMSPMPVAYEVPGQYEGNVPCYDKRYQAPKRADPDQLCHDRRNDSDTKPRHHTAGHNGDDQQHIHNRPRNYGIS